MTAHYRHHPGRHTWRLVLARLTLDRHAEQVLAHDIGDCPHCWRDIATELADNAAHATMARHGIPWMHNSGLVEGRAVDAVCGYLTNAITACDADARHDDAA